MKEVPMLQSVSDSEAWAENVKNMIWFQSFKNKTFSSNKNKIS
jgi:hypothetical protein